VLQRCVCCVAENEGACVAFQNVSVVMQSVSVVLQRMCVLCVVLQRMLVVLQSVYVFCCSVCAENECCVAKIACWFRHPS
jgi:hypothetical protein